MWMTDYMADLYVLAEVRESEGVTFLTKKNRGSLVPLDPPHPLYSKPWWLEVCYTPRSGYWFFRCVLYLSAFSCYFTVAGYLYKKEPFGVL